MLKTIAKLRNKRKKKSKSGSSNNLSESCDGGDSSNGFSNSRNSSRASLAASDDGFLSNGVELIKPSDDDLSDRDDIKLSKPDDTVIKADQLEEVFVAKHADEDRLFRADFEFIAAYVASQKPKCDFSKQVQFKEKNRYRNIVSCDDSRVKLQKIDGEEGSDYINASYIDGHNSPNKFIAAQGPKESTVVDFWRMIWEQRCYVIVMITELREVGRYNVSFLPSPHRLPGQKKCELYWPEDGSKEYGNIRVQLESTFQYGGFTKRSLKVTHCACPDEVRVISQFQYRAWPDHGVPKTTSEIFRFRFKTLEAQSSEVNAGPIVVHCSAGVGRTGTYIALDALLGQLDDRGEIDVFSLIADFRMRRTEMVQSLDQYVLLHKLLTEYYELGVTDLSASEFDALYRKVKSVDMDSEETGFDFQFKLLDKSYPLNRRLGPGELPHNKEKNRSQDVIPYEHSKVFVRMRPMEQSPLYYNASNLEAYDVNSSFIAAQGPMEHTVEDFWRVVIDNYVTCIVMVTALNDGDQEQCFKYWPDKGSVQFGEITVENKTTTDHQLFVESQFSVTYDKVTNDITHLRYLAWEEEDAAPLHVGAAVLKLADAVNKHLSLLTINAKPRVLVHCSDGAGRTGVFCTVINLLERLKRENRIDVLRAVKDLRDCRPRMVKSKPQYALCYDIIHEYLVGQQQHHVIDPEVLHQSEDEQELKSPTVLVPEPEVEIQKDEEQEPFNEPETLTVQETEIEANTETTTEPKDQSEPEFNLEKRHESEEESKLSFDPADEHKSEEESEPKLSSDDNYQSEK